jgi:protein-L-isoaspartate(D-aspartate) O-methyltransferase
MWIAEVLVQPRRSLMPGVRLRFCEPSRTTAATLRQGTGMFDAAMARRLMVDGQVRTADVTNLDLIAAMMTVPREQFVPPSLAEQAYIDADLEIAPGRALLRPMVLAKLIQAASPTGSDHVLDVACGTGYSSAVLSRLVDSVVALEEDQSLAQQARQALANAAATNVSVVTGALTAGWESGAKYDWILLNGATETAPDRLGTQLKPGGRLLCIFGGVPATKATVFRVVEGQLVGRPVFDAVARVLPGFVAPLKFIF